MRLPRRALIAAALVVACVPAAHAQGAGLADLLPRPQAPTPAPAHAGMPALTPVHLSVRTTSDWSVVQILGARIVDARIRSTSTGTSVSSAGDGWGVRAPEGGGTAEIDAVLALPATDPILRVEKGWKGETTATLTPGAQPPVTVAATMQAQPAVANAAVPQAALAEATARPPRADSRRLALAFYYPWFSDYSDWRLAEKPTNPRSATDAAGVLSMTTQARAAGLDGFVVSWKDERSDGVGYDLALRAAEQTGGLVAPYLEVGALDAQTLTAAGLADRVHASLTDVLKRKSSPATLRADDGVPVVFSFATSRLPASAWRAVLARLQAEGNPVRLVGDAGGEWYQGQWGVHQYLANETPDKLVSHWAGTAVTQRAADLLDGTRHLVTATVSPGFDDTKMRPLTSTRVPRQDGVRYEQTWDAALAADPDWILVTSWNEWFEGTEIEPGTVNGSRALEQTTARVAGWRGATIGSAGNAAPGGAPAPVPAPAPDADQPAPTPAAPPAPQPAATPAEQEPNLATKVLSFLQGAFG